MPFQRMYKALFAMEPLPKVLKDERLQKDFRDAVNERLIYNDFPKNKHLLSEGQVADHIYFVQDGIIRGYYINTKTEHQVTNHLWRNEDFVTDITSFFLRTPATINIQTLTHCTLFYITYADLQEVYRLFPPAESLATALILQYNYFHDNRNRALTTLSAWERYQQMLAAHPKIELRVSKEIIASFLNIAPQSLSRLLREHHQ